MPRLLIAGLVCLMFSVACDNSNGDSTPTAGTPTLTTDTFTGTVDVMGTKSHNFTVAQAGPVSITLTAAGPPSTIFMGLGVGTPATDGTCTLLAGASTSTQAGTSAQLTGSAGAGTFCVAIFDIGNQSAAITYTITVQHS